MKRQTIYIAIVLGLVSVTGFAGTAPDSNSLEKQSEHEAEIVRLINILDMSSSEKKMKQVELDEAIADIAAMGDQVIEPMMDKIRQDHGLSFQHRTVRVLKAIGTPKAQEALLDIALGRDPNKGTGSRWAAVNYIESLQDKSDARKLLVSKRPDILSSSLLAMKGVTIDDELLERLEELLESKSWFLRIDTAMVMGADPVKAYAREKVSAIIKSMGTIKELPEANQPFPNPLAIGTIADHIRARFIDALGQMKGANSYLRDITSKVKGEAQWCVLIARAKRGDTSVKGELYNIIRNLNAGLMRAWAAGAFQHIGTPEDLSFLQELTETDPLSVEVYKKLRRPNEKPTEMFYPVRFRAQLAIKSIEKKSKEKGEVPNDV
jgi:hypothetical protein